MKEKVEVGNYVTLCNGSRSLDKSTGRWVDKVDGVCRVTEVTNDYFCLTGNVAAKYDNFTINSMFRFNHDGTFRYNTNTRSKTSSMRVIDVVTESEAKELLLQLTNSDLYRLHSSKVLAYIKSAILNSSIPMTELYKISDILGIDRSYTQLTIEQIVLP